MKTLSFTLNIFYLAILLISTIFSGNTGAALKLNESRTLCYSYSGITDSACFGILKPLNSRQVKQAYTHALKNHKKITIRGSGYSSGEQCLPGATTDTYLLSTQNMKDIKLISETDNTIVLRVAAGITWREAIRWVKQTRKMDVIPFDAPAVSDTTISGSYSAHAYSGRSHINNCYMPDYVQQLQLITPAGTLLCRYLKKAENDYTAVGEMNSSDTSSIDQTKLNEICSYLPGSLGKFGVITELDVAFEKIPENFVIESDVITKSNNLDDFITHLVANTTEKEKFPLYNYGVKGLLQWNDAGEFQGLLIGSAGKSSADTNITKSFPGYNEPTLYNQFRYALAHIKTSNWHDMLPETKGISKPFLWSFCHDTHTKKKKTLGFNYPSFISQMTSLFAGHDLRYRTVHQSWFIPESNIGNLKTFIMSVQDALKNPDFSLIKKRILSQELLPLPGSKHPSHITSQHGAGYLYTLVLAVRNDSETAQITAFLKSLTNQAVKSTIIPLIFTENHMENNVLKESNPQHLKLDELSLSTDPNRLLTSALWERFENT